MKENGQGSPDHKSRAQKNAQLKEAGRPSPGYPTPQREQSHGGGVNKPELPPPKEIPLAPEPNLPSQEQQPNALDSEVERLMRAYAEAEAEGNPKKAERLFKRYINSSSLREFFKNLKLRGAPTLVRRGLDLSNLMEKEE